ncbi:guanylate cyclase [Adlercreutzia faecimuris]|uniref:Guanylate cyclase n=1 Tax=Adlercreutzia faecimuris TaxID=2897341 RepID=A0ABS9WEW4_9ACTN|nr:guanylate cyclase [Adlercreutzia sp. JBNU-10]MCI2241007.1 guanylate cyclase [Adlercreutzia sp. JBNU-10]
MGLVARLSRVVPLVIALAVVAAVIYLVVTYRHSPARAKEVLIRVFTWITGILSAFFGLVTLYALLERNDGVIDLGASFLVVALIGLAVTRWCNHVFLKNHPSYKKKPVRATVKRRWPWQR